MCVLEKEIKMKLSKLIGAATATFFIAQASAEVMVVNQGLSEQEVLNAQNGWCAALLDISKTNKTICNIILNLVVATVGALQRHE